ncbi:MAG: AMP-binding protein, partial [Acidobacteria bacterium]|nr:AMP-binding protein [Acidobacteriota bacterium]
MNEKIDDFENIEDIFPLSDIQMGMIYESLVPGTASVYYNQSIIPITDKNFDFERFKWAVSLLVEKHPMLRTGFNFEDSEEPVQVVYKKIELDIEHYDLCRHEPAAQEDYIKSCLRREREKFFDISAVKPLWRIRIFQTAENKIYFAWLNHHAIHDGWSFATFMTELNNTYLRLHTEPHFVPGQLKSTYKDFIIDQVIEKRNITTIEFWKNELADYKRFEIPGRVGVPGTAKSKKISIVEKLGSQAFENLKGIVKKYNISLRHICFAAYVYTLYMVSYENDFVVGIVTHNRPECEDGDKIIGCFLNEVPVKVSIPAELKWIDFIFMIDRKLIQLTEYNKLSLFEIARITAENIPGKNPFFDTIFNYTDFHIFNRMDRSLISEISEISENTSPLSDNTQIETNTPLDFSVDISGLPLLTVSFFDNMLTTGMGRKLCHYFINIIDRFGTEIECFASKEAIMSNEEKEKILYQFNNSEADFPPRKTIPQLFAEQVNQTPGAVALTAADPRTCPILSYAQLNKNSGCLASRLKEQGIIPDDIIGIMVERSTGMIIGILGILIAGGAYLPIEPTLPKERIDYMLKESAAKLLLTAPEIEYFSKECVFNSHHSAFITHHLNPSNLAYVIYTSGSTGKPKGVLNIHANIVRIAKNTDCLTVTPADRILQMSNYAFDGSVFDIYGALLNGAALVLTNKETTTSVELLAGIIKREQVTVFLVTTALFNILIDLEKESCKNVRKILFGGERVSVEHTRKALEYLGKEKIIHAYGPTESTVYASYYPVNEIHSDATLIPIGKPLSNTVIYINDKNKHLTYIGVKGEIYIGGQGIARGYLNNPELTADRFKRNAISQWSFVNGKFQTDNNPLNLTNDQCPMTNDYF